MRSSGDPKGNAVYFVHAEDRHIVGALYLRAVECRSVGWIIARAIVDESGGGVLACPHLVCRDTDRDRHAKMGARAFGFLGGLRRYGYRKLLQRTQRHHECHGAVAQTPGHTQRLRAKRRYQDLRPLGERYMMGA